MLQNRVRIWMLAGLLLCGLSTSFAQVFIGLNGGGLPGRTLELQTQIHPKNEDWIALNIAGGYTLKGPYFFKRKDECLSKIKNGGHHVKLGFRNNLTTQHIGNYLWWGAGMNYVWNTSSAISGGCDTLPEGEVSVSTRDLVLQFDAGYSMYILQNPLNERIQADFGATIGFPLKTWGTHISRNNYLSGVGFGRSAPRPVNFGLIATIRYKILHVRYGYSKPKKIKHKKEIRYWYLGTRKRVPK